MPHTAWLVGKRGRRWEEGRFAEGHCLWATDGWDLGANRVGRVDENSQERMTETAARRGLTRGNACSHEAPSRLDSRTTLGSDSPLALTHGKRDSCSFEASKGKP